MKKALVLVQGINHGIYLKDALLEAGFQQEDYDHIVEVPTEEIFDADIKKDANLWDLIGDAFQFYLYKNKRKQVCKLTRKYIQELYQQGYQIDALAHSLGCQILICCGSQKDDEAIIEINKTTLLASPLGFGLSILRSFIINHAMVFSKNFHSQELNYYWSRKDFVSKIFSEKQETIIQKVSLKHSVYEAPADHSVQKYYNFIKSKISSVVLN
jgi:hypothetical protein